MAVPETTWQPVPLLRLFRSGVWRRPAVLRLLVLWVTTIVLSYFAGYYSTELPTSWITFSVASMPVTVSIFLPLPVSILLFFWFGLEWAVPLVLVGSIGVALRTGMPLPYAAIFPLADPVALWFLFVVYRVSRIAYVPRTVISSIAYTASAVLASTALSTGGILLSQWAQYSAEWTFSTWMGWISGALFCFAIAAAFLVLFSTHVERWKAAALDPVPPEPLTFPGMALAVLVGGFILSGLVFAATDLLWQRVYWTFAHASLAEIRGDITVLEALWLVLTRVWIVLLVLLSLGGLALAALWSRALRQEVAHRTSALAEAEKGFRTTFEEAPVGIAHIGINGPFFRVNRKFCEILGYTQEEILRSRFYSIFDTSHPAGDQRDRLLSGEESILRGEHTYLRKDGSEVWVQIATSLARTESGQPGHFILILEDISERRAIEERLRQSNRMESVGRLAGGVAHDFNNLLTAIFGFCDIARAKVRRGESPDDALAQVHKAAERAAALTEQLLAFSRKQVVQPRILDLNAAVRDSLGLLQTLVGAAIRVDFHPSRSLLPVFADPNQISQILINLAANARDAMPGGGKLEILTRLETLDAAAAGRVEGVSAGPHAVLEVSDTGQGIPENVLNHIFDPFFTTKEPGRGTGLGLATVYGIVQQNGGGIAVATAPGRGAQFSIFWPARDEPVPLPQASAAVIPEARSSGAVLIAEDDPAIQNLMALSLRQAGYTVWGAPNAHEALALAESLPAPPDLLVTDVVMPGLSGMELAAQLRLRWPSLPVLFVSGHSETLSRAGLSEPFLRKPFTAATLAEKVLEAIRRR